MNATVSVIKFTQQKIETLHLQLKFHQKKEQQEHQQKGNRKKGKKSSSNNSFNTPQVLSTGTTLHIECTTLEMFDSELITFYISLPPQDKD